MANERIPNDPYRSGLSDDDFGRQAHLDDELRFDPEAPAQISGARVALFAVAIALVLGAVFYGLNNTSVHQAQTPPPAQTAQSQSQQSQPQSPLQAPPGMRDVTPHNNTNADPGVTTGQASSQAPTAPPRPAVPMGRTQQEIK
jgi:hypothetical protein